MMDAGIHVDERTYMFLIHVYTPEETTDKEPVSTRKRITKFLYYSGKYSNGRVRLIFVWMSQSKPFIDPTI